MKRKLFVLSILMIAVGVVFYFSAKQVFTGTHDRGNLICSNCHVMHARNTTDAGPGVETLYNSGTGFTNLLKQGNTSDACLGCHDGTDASAPDVISPALAKPGGDFNNITAAQTGHNVTDSGTIAANTKYENGANDVAPSHELVTAADVYFSAAVKFTCASCHDPHNATSTVSTNERLLRTNPAGKGVGAPAGYVAGAATFDIDTARTAADLVANAESATIHNGYQNVPTFCQDCHGNIHNDETGQSQGSWFRHPTGTTTTLANNSYDAVTFATRYGGGGLTYSEVYPLMEATNARGDTTMATTDKVFCLSCHQSHATTNSAMARWDKSAGVAGGAADGAGVKCNKCHNK